VRWLRRACLLSGGLCLSLGVAGAGLWMPAARADAPFGSGFTSFSLAATAPGMQVTYNFPGAQPSPQAEGEVPQSLAELQSGPQGYALSSVAWPGPLVANTGSTAQLLNLGLPSSTNNAADPVRAEARTGTGPPTVTNSSYPGTSMTATATPDDVEADATIAGANGPAPQTRTGNTETDSVSQLTGPAMAAATAHSVVQKVSLAGGVVTIGSVSSTATATSNGTKASASGGTIVNDLQIGGQPAYVDQSGIHLGQSGPSAPVNSIASAIANQALTGAGMKFAVSRPSTQVQGAQVTYNAGNLVFYWAPPGDTHGDAFSVTLGGASVIVGATPSFAVPAPASSAGGPTGGGGSGAIVPVGGSPPLAATSLPGGGALPATPGALSAPSPLTTPGLLPTLATRTAPLPGGLPPFLVILVILGSGLIAFGARRIPDRLLEQPSTVCTLGGQS